ncbi:sialidase family protein [Actinomadura sp. 7K534]|uniref:sialidase family protein n=1 Tax=Actinomadura sp. 7K534 TaxID=2530366 RepID=UPI00104AF80A|nr:sialidase family protein [Actinomadura sp. 7K534]TDB97852.1 exo-alpha-sialidase [Actinomadura sp. 7K534]
MAKRRPLAAAVVLVLLAAAGCGAWLRWRSGDEAAALGAWTYVPMAELSVQGAKPNLVLLSSDGERFVAVGRAGPPGGGSVIASWTSTDGRSWREGNLGAVARTRGAAMVTGLARVEGGFVAVGARLSSGAAQTFTGSAAWTSADGVVWKAIGTPPGDPFTTFSRPTLMSDGVHAYSRMGTSTWWRLGPDGAWRPFTPPGTRNCEQTYREQATRPGLFLYGYCGNPPQAALFTLDSTGRVHDRSQALGDRISVVETAGARGGTMIAAGYRQLPPDDPAAQAAGPPPDGPDDQGPPFGAAYARSADGGATWSPARTMPGTGPTDHPQVGRFTALGSAFLMSGLVEREGTAVPVLWTSGDDGETWRLHRLPGFAEGGSLGDPAEAGGRVVIPALVGIDPLVTAGVFVSTGD